MNSSFPSKPACWLAAILGLMLVGTAQAQTNFSVTTPGSVFQYWIDGATDTSKGMGNTSGIPTNNSPPLTLAAGATYTLSVSTAAFHPVGIVTTVPASASFYSNATPQGINSGTITITIPATNFPSTLYYQCNNHFFYGVITIVPPTSPPPPPNTIISIVVMPTNVTLLSSGTNTSFALVPQFNSNLISGSWLDVPSFSNTFANGTNTTSFGRLDAICGPNVFLRISQRPPQ